MFTPELFTWSWSQMIQYNYDYLVQPNEKIFYYRSKASYHAFSRNILASQVMGDWLLMLDTDHVFEPDLAARMLQRMEKFNIDVLVGIYLYTVPPYAPKLYRWSRKSNTYEPIGGWSGKYDLVPIGAAGAGCLLVKKKVFERIKKELKQEPFDIIPPYSEDFSFFEKLRKLKIKAYCDPTIEYQHLMFKSLSFAKDFKKDEVVLKRHSLWGLRMNEENKKSGI